MHARFLCLLLFILSAVTDLKAQDKIYLRKRGMIEAKVMQVTPARIYYRKPDDLSGKDFVVDWDDVHKLEYENGTVDYRKPLPVPHIAPVTYDGKNLASLAILNIGDEGFGMGMAYERILDEEAYFSFFMPVNFCLMAPHKHSSGDAGSVGYSKSVIQFFPGVKYYPTKNSGRARYAIGGQLSYETGNTTIENKYISVNGSDFFSVDDYRMQKLGFLLNNSINFFPNPKTYVAFDFGIGTTYYYTLDNVSQPARLLVQFNFRIGQRF
jgi:hypothetical protein